MKNLILALTVTLPALPAFAAHYDKKQIDDLYESEASGLRYYTLGDFPKAFSILSRTAAPGMKNSQYILGLMFIKGEGVDKNVLSRLAWMGLAAELGSDEWVEKHEGLYNSLSNTHKSMVDQKVREYGENFGASPQGVTCSKTAEVGSRAIRWKCRNVEGAYTVHETERPIRPE